MRRGVSILDIVGLASNQQALLPTDWAALLERAAVTDLTQTISGDYSVYSGEITGALDVFEVNTDGWPVELPGLTKGLPIRVALRRETPGMIAGNPPADVALEAAPTEIAIDLFLQDAAVRMPMLRPAIRTGDDGAKPLHLVPDPDNSNVRLIGSVGIGLRWREANGWSAQFIDAGDPFAPFAPRGFFASLRFDPESFFFAGSGFGATCRSVRLDASRLASPADVIARGQSRIWRGIILEELDFFLPRNLPLVGDVSAGVKGLMIPFNDDSAIQGEAHLQFGRSQVDPDVIAFFQSNGTVETSIAAARDGAKNDVFTVVLANDQNNPPNTYGQRPAQVRAHGATGRWTFPDGTQETGATTPSFEARAGDRLVFESSENVGNPPQDVFYPKTTFTFTEAGAARPFPPAISLTPDAQGTAQSVVSVSATLADLKNARFEATAAQNDVIDDDSKWVLRPTTPPGQDAPAALARAQGARFDWPDAITATGPLDLVLTQKDGRQRRIRITVLKAGQPMIGTAGHGAVAPRVQDFAGQPLAPERLLGQHDLLNFNISGRFGPFRGQGASTLSPLAVPDGALARVDFDDSPEVPPTPNEPVLKRVLLMDYNASTLRHFLGEGPTVRTEKQVEDALVDWLKDYEPSGQGTTEVFVIGQTSPEGSDTLNTALGRNRANRGLTIFNKAKARLPSLSGIGAAQSRGEAPPSGSRFATEPQVLNAAGAGQPQLTRDTGGARLGFLNRNLPPFAGKGIQTQPFQIERNVSFFITNVRRKAAAPKPEPVKPVRREMLVAGKDALIRLPSAKDPGDLPYRVKARAVWDSPRSFDWVPTLAEIEVGWQPKPLPLPANQGSVAPQPTDGGQPPDEWLVKLRASYDRQTGQTAVNGQLDASRAKKGIAEFSNNSAANNIMAAALAFGPPLVSGLSGDDITASGARLGALVLAGVAGATIVQNGKVRLTKIEIDGKFYGPENVDDGVYKVLFDYEVEMDVDTGSFLGLRTTKPIKIKYKSVGLKIDASILSSDDQNADFWSALSIVYDSAKFELVSSGSWQIQNALGNFLQVNNVKVGSGSSWIEIDLGFTLDSGVVEVSGAKVRITMSGNTTSVELRGLKASVNVPGVVRGSGALQIGADGDISARIDADIIPMQAKAGLGLRIAPQPEGYTHVALGADLRFATPIPLAATGLGINGFMGEFVAHGKRNVDTGQRDVVKRELEWYGKKIGAGLSPEQQKFAPEKDQWALGLGVVLGTLPDAGFSLNVEGMVGVAFPELEVLLGVNAKFMAAPPTLKDRKQNADQAALTGLLVIGQDAVTVAIKGSYRIPSILNLDIPVGARFPYPSSNDPFFIRIGADNQAPRFGDPISATVLPGSLEQQAWCYLMFEERELLNLGGVDALDFTGFSVGMGAGWGIDYRAGPLRLTADARLLVGIGLRPLTLGGNIRVRGSLDLGIVSVGASGELTGLIQDRPGQQPYYQITGKFCGRVRLLFVTVKGCLAVSYSNAQPLPLPPIDSPVDQLMLCDRKGRVVEAVDPGDQADARVWPDTVPTLKFAPTPQAALSTNSDFRLTDTISAPAWSGTSNTQIAYRITDVRMIETQTGARLRSDMDPKLNATWVVPPHRKANPDLARNELPPSSDEERALALLDWNQVPWAFNLGNNADPAQPGHPARMLLEACDEITMPKRACLMGGDILVDADAKLSAMAIARPGHTGVEKWRATGRFSAVGQSLGGLRRLASRPPMRFENSKRVPVNPTLDTPDPSRRFDEALRFPLVSMGINPLFSLATQLTPTPGLANPELLLRIPEKRKVQDRRTCYEALRKNQHDGKKIGDTQITGPITYRTLDTSRPLRSIFLDQWTLGFSPAGMSATFSQPVKVAEVTMKHGTSKTVWIEMFDSDGNRKIFKVTPVDKTSLTKILPVKDSAKITHIHIMGGGFEEGVLQICLTVDQAQRRGNVRSLDEGWGFDTRGPVVVGTTTDGQQHRWALRKINSDGAGNLLLVYVPERRQRDAHWDDVRILPLLGGWVDLLSLCGVNARALMDARRAAERQAAFLQSLGQARPIPPAAAGNASSLPYPDGEIRPILRPDTEYRIEVDWQGARWRKEVHGGQIPPDVASVPDDAPGDGLSWNNGGGTMNFRFRTSALAAQAPGMRLGAADLVNENSFRPEDVARYLSGLEPDSIFAPHFRDDALFAHFDVSYPRQLLNAYGRDLRLAFRRTDPKAGEGVQPALPPTEAQVLPPSEAAMPQAVRDMMQAARDAQCLLRYDPGGNSVAIKANLLAEARYDLLLFAPPQQDLDNESALVGRAHFQASRYANATELLADLGLTAQPNPVPPRDTVVRAQMPTSDDARYGTDAGFEAALRELELDPWPVTGTAQITPLWRRVNTVAHGQHWALIGVMIEGPEPFHREATLDMGDRVDHGVRLAPADRALLRDGDGRHALRLRFANGARTRLIYASTRRNGIKVSDTPEFSMTLLQDGGDRIAGQGFVPRSELSGSVILRSAPLQALLEGFE